MTDKTEPLSIITEVELIYRNKQDAKDRPIIKSSQDAYEIFTKTWNMDKIELAEHFRMILLDKKNSCLGVSTIATGGISSCLVDLKIAFATALKARASGIILAHNHPSGNLKQSPQDEKLTENFMKVGKILDLPILDHLIVTKNGYTSFADLGLISNPSPM